MLKIIPVFLVLSGLLGCGSEEAEVPSCEAAFGHFYGEGCAMFNSDGTMIPLGEYTLDCNAALRGVYQIGGSCQGAFEDFLRCTIMVVGDECGECNPELGIVAALCT